MGNFGQGKGYLWDATLPRSPQAELATLIDLSPKARRSFPRSDEIGDLFQFIVAKSVEYHVSPLLVLSLIDVESGFRPAAVSRRGAVGLMQLLPATAQELAESAGIIWYPELLNDPKANVELGLRYMKKLQEQFGGSEEKVLTAYNIGPHALRERLAQGEGVSLEYVQRVQNGMRRYGRNPGLPRKHARLWARAWQ